MTLKEQFKKAGERWLYGADLLEWNYGEKKLKFFPKQLEFINCRDKREQVFFGSYAGGKSTATLVKLLMMSLFFPNNSCLLGRRTMMDIEKVVLPQLFELIPSNWYTYKIKQGIIEFFNGSQIILFGLETMVSENLQDRKKAISTIRGLNLGCIAVEQAENIEESVWNSLSGRLRRENVPIRLMLANCNPSAFWGFNRWIQAKDPDILVVQAGMKDNPYLPRDFIDQQIKLGSQDEDYRKRFVEGQWDISIMARRSVFDKLLVDKLEQLVAPPLLEENEFLIWEQPQNDVIKYYIGCDVGIADDPTAIVVVSDKGKLVARWVGYLPIPAIVEKINFIYHKYHLNAEPLLVVEANASGVAIIELTRELKHYQRRVYEIREKKWVDKVGFFTSHSTKALLISHFQNLLRQDFFLSHDRELVEQLRVFVWKDAAKEKLASASAGFKDDVLMATMLACISLKGKVILTPEEIQKIKHQRDERMALKIQKAQNPRWREYI